MHEELLREIVEKINDSGLGVMKKMELAKAVAKEFDYEVLTEALQSSGTLCPTCGGSGKL